MEEKILVKGIFYGEKVPLFLGIALGVLSLIIFCSISDYFVVFGLISGFSLLIIGAICTVILVNRELIITNKRIIVRTAFGIRKDFVIKNITDTVMYGWLPRSFSFDGISVATPSSRISFGFCKNKEELFNTISAQILTDNNT